VLECVINVSEGRDAAAIAAIASAAGRDLLDVHSDPHHHRSVLTVVGEVAARAVASRAFDLLDLRDHDGVHPRLGVVDVVPFVALDGSEPADALDARDRFVAWFTVEHGVPCFRYGPERTLPDVRRHAFRTLAPDAGPGAPHRTAGACAVGARSLLVAYNVWLAEPDLERARGIAAAVRGPAVRALGLQVGDRVQVSLNLIDPELLGPGEAYDLVATMADEFGAAADGAELVGLVPDAVLRREPTQRWSELDLSAERTIEARLATR